MHTKKSLRVANWMRRCAATVLISITEGAFAEESSSAQALKRQRPALYSLVVQYADYVPALERYAQQQGFTNPVERLATVVHEIVHVASAAHQGYYIDGVYYEPYVASAAWPTLTNRDVMPYMLEGEKGIMYSVYMKATQANRLGNVLDEVNAYNHVVPFVCLNEAASSQKQVTNLIGLLHIVEAYLRVARTVAPRQYTSLHSNRLSSGALITIVENAWAALDTCRIPYSAIPRGETQAFFARLKSNQRRHPSKG